MSDNVTKIVLTGGPCAGKTTALARIVEHFTSRDYQVFIIPEVPTMFSQAGVDYLTKNKDYFYEAENATLHIQMGLEDHFLAMAKKIDKPTIIVCDRGTMDISVYLAPETWQSILKQNNLTPAQLRDERYDAVLHMVTAANGAEEHYTNSNNKHRSEGIELARELDNRLVGAWKGHPNLKVIDNSEVFDTKISNVINEISAILGMPYSIEPERKYIVEITDDIPNCVVSIITHTYLMSDPDSEISLRKRETNGKFVYLLNTKVTQSDGEVIETERNITRNQYMSMLRQADHNRIAIEKVRRNFSWGGRYFKLDSYIQPANQLNILQIEGSSDHDSAAFPPFLTFVKDITGDSQYSNDSLSIKQ